MTPPSLPPPPPLDKLPGLASPHPDDLRAAYEAEDDPTGHLDRELTPALLAAKAEPLGHAEPPKRRSQRKSQRPLRPSDGGARARTASASGTAQNRAKNRSKPKSPSKLLLALGVLGVILLGVAAGYIATQGGSDDDVAGTTTVPTTAPSQPDVTTTGDGAGDGAGNGAVATDSTDVAAGPTAERPPDVVFDEAAVGPIEAGVPYSLGVFRGPPEPALYRLLVEGEPQGDPAPELAPVTFEPGRHLLVIEITSQEGNVATNPVVVYAVGGVPEPSWRANLASVNRETEGWAEAVRRFDGFIADGHTGLELMPSDPYPFLTPGYWNLFVDGFPTRDAALAYCAQFGLQVPDQCFAKRFDAGTPAGG